MPFGTGDAESETDETTDPLLLPGPAAVTASAIVPDKTRPPVERLPEDGLRNGFGHGIPLAVKTLKDDGRSAVPLDHGRLQPVVLEDGCQLPEGAVVVGERHPEDVLHLPGDALPLVEAGRLRNRHLPYVLLDGDMASPLGQGKPIPGRHVLHERHGPALLVVVVDLPAGPVRTDGDNVVMLPLYVEMAVH